MKKMWLVLGMMAAASLAFGQAKDYPNSPVRIIVPLTAGSGTDSSARFFGAQLARIFGQAFVVENQTGASGMIGGGAVKRAPADGYTIFLGTITPLGLNQITMKEPFSYDSIKDLKPLSGLTRGMSAFVVSPNSKLKTLADLVAAAKTAKQPPNVGTYSTAYHLSLNWFASLVEAKFESIPYKGAAPIFTDLMGNRLDWAILDLGGVSPLLKSGKLRAIAVTGETRHPEFPDLPTVKESGYPEYVNYLWTSFYVRTETPDDVTNKLADALQNVLASNEAKEYVKKVGGGELMPYTPAVMRKAQLDEIERYRRIANASGFKPE